MSVTTSKFRTDFPEFSNTTAYPEALVSFYLTLGAKLMSVDRWADIIDEGLELFVAHNLALERPAQKTAAAGGVPGIASGPVSSKTVDKVSVSYDTSAAMEADAGHWNLTIYGQRYIRLARMVGSGGIQL